LDIDLCLTYDKTLLNISDLFYYILHFLIIKIVGFRINLNELVVGIIVIINELLVIV